MSDLGDARSHQTAEHARKRRGSKEIGEAQALFVSVIDHGDIETDAWEEAGLADSQDQTYSEQTGVVFDESRADGNDRPGGGHDGNRAVYLEPSESKHEGHHEHDVSRKEDTDGRAELGAAHIQVLAKTRDGSVADVGTVEIGPEQQSVKCKCKCVCLCLCLHFPGGMNTYMK